MSTGAGPVSANLGANNEKTASAKYGQNLWMSTEVGSESTEPVSSLTDFGRISAEFGPDSLRLRRHWAISPKERPVSANGFARIKPMFATSGQNPEKKKAKGRAKVGGSVEI